MLSRNELYQKKYRRVVAKLKRTKQKQKKRFKKRNCGNAQRNSLLLEHIKLHSTFDWKLLVNDFKYEDYVWWSYLNLKGNVRFRQFSDILEMENRCNGTPKCIIKVVQLINEVTFFNERIRYCLWIILWNQKIFTYYDRYYRYFENERLFGEKKFLNYRHGHKLHFISCIKNRELTGVRLNKNHFGLCF